MLRAALAGVTDSEPVLLGRITGVFGVRGWVRVFSYTRPREAILGYKGCMARVGDQWQPIEWLEGRRHGKSVVAKLPGVDDREAAAAWIGTEIAILRDAMPETEPGTFYWSDLEGLEVVNKDGRSLGTVAHLLETGANDVLVVRRVAKNSEGNQEILIPFVREIYILDVDIAGGKIRVDWEWE